MSAERIRIAIQKSGRLTAKSVDLLTKCGMAFEWRKETLFSKAENFPLDLMFVRDDDIPSYVADGVCDLGIVGLNVRNEKAITNEDENKTRILKSLGFGNCRLSLAIPRDQKYTGINFFQGLRIATTYPAILKDFFDKKHINAQVIQMNGSVEIAPTLHIADAICDLVSTGSTLRANGLRPVETILESQSVLIRTASDISKSKEEIICRLLERMNGVLKAGLTKYIMMNAPRSALSEITKIIPGCEQPSIMPLEGAGDKIAIHAVARENIFWETMEALKRTGATSILVLPIEKIIE